MDNIRPLKEFKVNQLNVRIYSSRSLMGKAVAHDVYDKIFEILKFRAITRMIFAAAPSQNEFLASLRKYEIAWNRIEAYHMDEYIGIDDTASQGFGNFLKEAIFKYQTFKAVNYIQSKPANLESECQRYSALIKASSIDICAMGIGENGHLAFNDPSVANFNDPLTMKTVELDPVCRQQQVNDACFTNLDDVPKQAFTLTIPTLLACKYLFVTVPGRSKAGAVYKTLNSKINTDCPSTILRNYSNAILYLDQDSSSLIS